MNIVLLALNLAFAFAAPAPEPYVSTSSFDSRSRGIQYSSANAKILGQINQHNEDGSYTFGYESDDGSFRIENRDVDGFVSGKYGYVDANGQTQEFEYAAGSMNGQAIGYQTRGTALPETNRGQEFPVVYPATSSSVDQKFQDYEYLSVDDDRDGFPDNIFHGSFGTRDPVSNVVRVTGTLPNIVPVTNTVQVSQQNPSSVVRLTPSGTSSFQKPTQAVPVVNRVQVTQQNPSVVRLTSSAQNSIQNPSSNIVRLTPSVTSSFEQPAQAVPVVNRVQVSQQNPSVVRLTSSAQNSFQNPSSNIVRLTPSGTSFFEQPEQAVPVINRVQVSQQKPSVVRLTSPAQTSSQNPSNVVRFVNPAQVSNQQQIVRLPSSAVIQPTRLSGGRYQVSTQRQPQFIQDVQSVYQSPSNDGGQRIVPTRNPVYHPGRLNSFLGGRFVVGENNKPNTFSPSNQQQAVFIDSDDFDDLRELDDDYFDDDNFFPAGLSSVFIG